MRTRTLPRSLAPSTPPPTCIQHAPAHMHPARRRPHAGLLTYVSSPPGAAEPPEATAPSRRVAETSTHGGRVTSNPPCGARVDARRLEHREAKHASDGWKPRMRRIEATHASDGEQHRRLVARGRQHTAESVEPPPHVCVKGGRSGRVARLYSTSSCSLSASRISRISSGSAAPSPSGSCASWLAVATVAASPPCRARSFRSRPRIERVLAASQE
mmetsp:Transcript_37383/g.79656  ORF Transcript_37383/g.79656 Transcript_37383/m.79656 type:complete len:215 (+) Transcript_37383:356-1000(+)